jgi:hypothetical protein
MATTEKWGSESHAGGGNGSAPFDIRKLIRRHIRESDPSDDPVAIARRVIDAIPEAELRGVVAKWLPMQVANELFNLNAERTGRRTTTRPR